MSVKFVIDSASDISKTEAEQLGITMIPVLISFQNEDYYDGIDLLPYSFYTKLADSKELPKTSQINAFKFEEEFDKLTKKGDEVVVITISSKLSGTYNSALQASKKYKCQVYVVDSLSASAGERLLLYYGLQLAKQGKSAKEIAQELEVKRSKLVVMAAINTLEYLKRGGRISSAIAFAASLISLKPIIGIVDGEVKLIGKSMGSKNAIKTLNKLIVDKGGLNTSLPFGIIYSGISKTLPETFVEQNPQHWHNSNVNYYVLGCTIGSHIGPGAIGVAFFQK